MIADPIAQRPVVDAEILSDCTACSISALDESDGTCAKVGTVTGIRATQRNLRCVSTEARELYVHVHPRVYVGRRAVQTPTWPPPF